MTRGAIENDFSDDRREAVTRAILAAPAEQTHEAVGAAAGVSRETARKVRYGLMYAHLCPELERLERGAPESLRQMQMQMNTDRRTTEQRDELTRAVLTANVEIDNGELARRLGITRESVRMIRNGQMYATHCPELPRLVPGTMQRNCTHCVHFVRERIRRSETMKRVGRCGLGLPEALIATKFARGCGAFAPLEADA